MIKRSLLTLVLSVGLLLGGLAVPAQAHSGHWCGHTGSHYWTGPSGNQIREQFDAHWDVNVGGSQTRHRHQTKLYSDGAFYSYGYKYC